MAWVAYDVSTMFTVKPDEKELAEIERTLGGIPGALERVTYRAINTALGKMRSLTTKAAAKYLGLKQKIVKKRVWMKRANRKHLYGQVKAGRVGWPYIDFDPTQTGKAPKPGGGVTVPAFGLSIPHAFLATMPSGHTGVFLRAKYMQGLVGKRTRRGRVLPTAIVEQRSEAVSEAIESLAVAPEIVRVGGEVLEKRLLVEMDLILSGKRK
jgi:hypothetical protein